MFIGGTVKNLAFVLSLVIFNAQGSDLSKPELKEIMSKDVFHYHDSFGSWLKAIPRVSKVVSETVDEDGNNIVEKRTGYDCDRDGIADSIQRCSDIYRGLLKLYGPSTVANEHNMQLNKDKK